MAPDHYVVLYTEEARRIFVIISEAFGDFVLTKTCAGVDCGCIGCRLLSETVAIGGAEFPILDFELQQIIADNLVAYPFTKEGEAFLLALKLDRYKAYRGTVSKEEFSTKSLEFHPPLSLSEWKKTEHSRILMSRRLWIDVLYHEVVELRRAARVLDAEL